MSVTTENMKVTLSAPELQVEPGQAAELVISVKNLSEVVDQYQLEVQELDPRWVDVLIGSVSLFPHDEDSLRLILKPPRSSEAHAGEHSFKVTVRSREFPEATYSATLSLKIAPFSGFEASLAPERLTTRRRGTFELELTNTGNCPLQFNLTASDSEQGCLFEFSPAQIEVDPGKSARVALGAEPKQKPKIGSPKTYSVAVVITPRGYEPRSLACQVSYQPPIPRWVPGAAVVAALLGAVVVAALLRSPPVIQTFQVSPETINPGEQATLTWEVSGASRVAITPEPGENLKPQDSAKLSPAQTTLYKLTAKKGWSSPVEKQITLVVTEAPNIQTFMPQPAQIDRGQATTLIWEVTGVKKVNISGVGTVPASGSRVVRPKKSTEYILSASNGAGTRQLSTYVEVSEPAGSVASALVARPATEIPFIKKFEAYPTKVLIVREDTTLSWEVYGADRVVIEPGIGEVDPNKGRVKKGFKLPGTETFTLTATNSLGKSTAKIKVDAVVLK